MLNLSLHLSPSTVMAPAPVRVSRVEIIGHAPRGIPLELVVAPSWSGPCVRGGRCCGSEVNRADRPESREDKQVPCHVLPPVFGGFPPCSAARWFNARGLLEVRCDGSCGEQDRA